MNRIRTAIKTCAARYLEAMAYADPSGFGYYPPELFEDVPEARPVAQTVGVGDTVPVRRSAAAVAA